MFRSASSNNFYAHTDVTDPRRCVQNTARTNRQTFKSECRFAGGRRVGHGRMSTDITNMRHAVQNTERARQRHWSDTPASTVIQHDVVPNGKRRVSPLRATGAALALGGSGPGTQHAVRHGLQKTDIRCGDPNRFTLTGGAAPDRPDGGAFNRAKVPPNLFQRQSGRGFFAADFAEPRNQVRRRSPVTVPGPAVAAGGPGGGDGDGTAPAVAKEEELDVQHDFNRSGVAYMLRGDARDREVRKRAAQVLEAERKNATQKGELHERLYGKGGRGRETVGGRAQVVYMSEQKHTGFAVPDYDPDEPHPLPKDDVLQTDKWGGKMKELHSKDAGREQAPLSMVGRGKLHEADWVRPNPRDRNVCAWKELERNVYYETAKTQPNFRDYTAPPGVAKGGKTTGRKPLKTSRFGTAGVGPPKK